MDVRHALTDWTSNTGQVLRFLLAGGLATLVHWLCMAALVQVGVHAPIATSIAALAGASLNYLLQRRHAFASRNPHRSTLPRYVLASAIGWIANLLLFSALYSAAGLSAARAQLMTTAVLAALNYLLYSRLVFNEPAPDQAAVRPAA